MTGSPASSARTAPPIRIPLVRPDLPSAESLGPAIARAFETGMVTKGACLREFEEAAAAVIGCRHAILRLQRDRQTGNTRLLDRAESRA